MLISVNKMPLLTAAETAKRLGIKLNTVYAYVSRGVLLKHLATDGSSRFDSREVEQLARRGRPRISSQETSINLLVESSLTHLSETGVSYRGHNTSKLIRTHTFEEVAELLWTGDLRKGVAMWPSSTLVAMLGPLDQQIRILVAQVPILDANTPNAPTSRDVAIAGRSLIASIVDSLPPINQQKRSSKLNLEGRLVSGTIAARLWPVLTAQTPSPSLIHLLNSALILLADHELATSAFAVRVAASTHAAPSAAVLAGLGAMQGPLHGGASRLVRELLVDALDRGAHAAVSERVQGKKRVAGFGHRVYAGADPRAILLLDLLRKAMPKARALLVADEVAREAYKLIKREPNVDLALAAIELATDMQPHSAETIFTVARIAGWLAHASEEYGQAPLRFRVRARYVGLSKL
jgi:citrate synthase